MRLRLSWIVALLVFAMAFMNPAAAQDGLGRITAAQVLKVGIAPNAPWVMKKPDGTWTGHDIDLINAMAQDLGVRPSYVELPFADLVPAVARGDVDMAAAGIAITPQRAQIVAFSTPTGFKEIATVADRAALGADPAKAFESRSFRIAVLQGSTDEAAARRTFSDATVTPYPTAAAALAALIDGKAQAMVATAPVPRMAASLFDAKLRLIGRPLQRTAEAFALRPTDIRLLIYVNNWIAARDADGFIANIGTHWFDGHKWLDALRDDKRPKSAAAR